MYFGVPRCSACTNRSAGSSSENEIAAEVGGLGPGRFRVTVRAYRDVVDDEGPPHFDEIIEFDGESTIERSFELR